jgi:hypothetical protein
VLATADVTAAFTVVTAAFWIDAGVLLEAGVGHAIAAALPALNPIGVVLIEFGGFIRLAHALTLRH